MFFFFFFQAEDGIRDSTVTGVQTCALPISRRSRSGSHRPSRVASSVLDVGRAEQDREVVPNPLQRGDLDPLTGTAVEQDQRVLDRAQSVLDAKAADVGTPAAGARPEVAGSVQFHV